MVEELCERNYGSEVPSGGEASVGKEYPDPLERVESNELLLEVLRVLRYNLVHAIPMVHAVLVIALAVCNKRLVLQLL